MKLYILLIEIRYKRVHLFLFFVSTVQKIYSLYPYNRFNPIHLISKNLQQSVKNFVRESKNSLYLKFRVIHVRTKRVYCTIFNR